MNPARLRPIYLVGIVLNTGALVYAVSLGEYLFASAFVFVIVYLMFRYRTTYSSH